jgi:hypothetical protein
VKKVVRQFIGLFRATSKATYKANKTSVTQANTRHRRATHSKPLRAATSSVATSASAAESLDCIESPSLCLGDALTLAGAESKRTRLCSDGCRSRFAHSEHRLLRHQQQSYELHDMTYN